uniref:Uncharacterized protein n=1 Tax=Timema bartmani TaxID=61472 RepID=A0A7R9EPD3_9NEOP|nr:unnamed protein product [Timema bartmani]
MESKNVLSEVKEQLTNVNPFQPGAPIGMQRDNESIDDFEHLEPESSPAKETVGSISHDILDSKLVNLDSGPILSKLTEKKDDLECSLSSHSKADPFDLKGELKNKLPENLVDTSSQFLDFADTAKPIDTASLSKSDVVDPIVNSSKDFLAQFEKSGTESLGEVKELSPFSKFDSPLDSHSGGQKSSLAFMEAERGGLFDKPIGLPPKENKADTFSDELEFLKFESEPAKDVFPEKHIGTEIIKEKDQSPEPKPDLYTSSIKDQYDIDEDFPSSDKLPEASKEKISEKSETIFHDFHDEDKDLDSLELQDEASKVDPIKYGDKEIVKPHHELPSKISPGPNTKPSAPELDLGFKSSLPTPLPTVTPLPAAPQAKPKTVSKNEPDTKIEQISKKTKLDVELIGEPLDLGYVMLVNSVKVLQCGKQRCNPFRKTTSNSSSRQLP